MEADICDFGAHNSAIYSRHIMTFTCMFQRKSYIIVQNVGYNSDWVGIFFLVAYQVSLSSNGLHYGYTQ